MCVFAVALYCDVGPASRITHRIFKNLASPLQKRAKSIHQSIRIFFKVAYVEQPLQGPLIK